MDPFRRGAVALAEATRRGQGDIPEVVEEALSRVEAHDGNAFLTCHRREAKDRARRLQAMVDAGEDPGPLAGVPVALKDNMAHRGMPCGCASRILEGYVAPYTATPVARLEAAGAIVLGRTNMDEFAMGSSTENSAWGPTSNPWHPDLVPGGSSGGSAAAVAADLVPLALGSDTGGSIRQPAALTGIVGLKPTWGRVSRHGLVAFASSLDQVGPMAHRVEDVARLLTCISGHDPQDSTSSKRPVPPWEEAVGRGVSGLRVGLLLHDTAEVHPGALEARDRAARILERAGAVVEDVDMPWWHHGLPCYYVLAPAEASSNLARYDGVRYGPREEAGDLWGLYEGTRTARLGPEVKRRILLGTFALSTGHREAFYLKAEAVRDHIRARTMEVLDRLDLILSPTTTGPAFRLGERVHDPLAMYLSDYFTVPASLVGAPAISVPGGITEGLPIGVQLTARPWDEASLLAAAGVIQASVGLLHPTPRQ